MKRILLCFLILFLASCSDPKSTVLPKDPDKWEAEIKESVQKLSEEDKKLLLAYTLRVKMGTVFGGKDIPDGMTIGKAIEEQKKFAEEKKAESEKAAALKEKMEKEENALKEQVDKILTVSVLDVGVKKADYRSSEYMDKLYFVIGLENKGSKDIEGAMGAIVFTDMFGKDIVKGRFKFEDGIMAGSTMKWHGERDFNQFMEKDKAFARLSNGKFTTRFVPEIVLFTDGTKISIGQ